MHRCAPFQSLNLSPDLSNSNSRQSGITHLNKDNKEQITFDGKVVCGSKHGKKIDALPLMTAMVVENGLVIYQKETSSKTNEIPIMQSMLEAMDVENAVITADAMHCQTQTTSIISEGKGDYVLQPKKIS